MKSSSGTSDCSISVAFIYHFFPHYRAGVIKELSRRFASTFVGDSKGAEGIRAYQFEGVGRFHLVNTWYLGRFVFQPGVVWYCLTASHDAFVFLANPNHVSTWVAALAVRIRGKRVVFWGHGFKSSNSSLKNLARKLFFGIAHGFYTYGWRAKKNAIALGSREESVYVGFNSLDYESQRPVRDSLMQRDLPDVAGAGIRIFCISRLTELCRYDMLLEATVLVRQGGLSCSITIVGEGPERASLEAQALDLGLDVAFLGAIYDEGEIAKLVFDADVTVSPGKVGLTAMHSLMYGTPVISNDNFVSQMPEVEAIVPGRTGEFFREGDVTDLASTLLAFKSRFPSRAQTRSHCFQMMDSIYNPDRQAQIMTLAVRGRPAPKGDDAFVLFGDA
jgi:glycosyltransferase involved in cell wall biosynthesis